MSALLDRLTSHGPKRILSIDGGGIRGLVALGFLSKIEQILGLRTESPSTFRLCDYFDLIGGTSTGAIIASCLSIGMSVEEVRKLYLKLGSSIFQDKTSIYRRYTGAKFSNKALSSALSDTFGSITLGDETIRTGLCIVLKRLDTGSSWPLINHPHSIHYFKNSGILLRDAIRASTAAPTFFAPEILDVGGGEKGVFIDGGVSMYNNPSLLLFLVATLRGFSFRWQTGEDDLLLASVGTGTGYIRPSIERVMSSRVWDWARNVPDLLMRDASIQNDLLLRYISKSKTGNIIDSEIGDLDSDLLGDSPQISYLRYSVDFDTNELQRLGLSNFNIAELLDMSNARNIRTLDSIGKRAAEYKISNEHFLPSFDKINQSKHGIS